YTRDIVYRDGSYYAPADEQYGDYYYAPEEDYSDYDNYPYYGSNSFYGNSWYGLHDSYGCRFSYHYDRYCDNGWGNVFINIGGFSLMFGDSHYYGNGYGYPYYGSYPYYGYYTSPPRPEYHGAIPMPKPIRPAHQVPDYGVNSGLGVRVPGEPIRMPMKPGRVVQDPVNPMLEPDTDADQNLNPYARTRHRLRPVQADIPENASDDNVRARMGIREPRQVRPVFRDGASPRSGFRPLPSVDVETNENYQKPIRQERRPQPYPVNVEPQNDPSPTRAVAPQVRERVERTDRPQRIERSERSISSSRQEPTKEGNERL
ncbi:MAG: hypothetical protein ABIP02_10205, partial [Arenimonas sp.]